MKRSICRLGVLTFFKQCLMPLEKKAVYDTMSYSNPRKSCGNRKRGRGLQGKAEDAGGLAPVKDDNAAMRFPDR